MGTDVEGKVAYPREVNGMESYNGAHHNIIEGNVVIISRYMPEQNQPRKRLPQLGYLIRGEYNVPLSAPSVRFSE